MEQNNETNNKKKTKKSGCFKKIIIGAGIIGSLYLGNKVYNHLNNSERKYQAIENRLSNLEKTERTYLISNYINKDSLDLNHLVNGLNNEKSNELIYNINSLEKLTQEQKIEHIINTYNNLDRKNKFETVKELTRNTIGF